MSAPRYYIFAHASRIGPCVRRFDSVTRFDAFVREWRLSCGPVQFDSPFVARGAL